MTFFKVYLIEYFYVDVSVTYAKKACSLGPPLAVPVATVATKA